MTEADQALVARALQGDERAFAAIYQRYHAVLARRLRRVLGSKSDVEDVLQVTFVEAYRGLARFDLGKPLEPWLHSIAFRQVANHLRRARRWSWLRLGREDDPIPVDEEQPSSEEQVINRQLTQLLYQALAKLPANKRIAFTLHTLEGLGLTEIGQMTSASPQTVRARILSARQALLKQFNRSQSIEVGKMLASMEHAR